MLKMSSRLKTSQESLVPRNEEKALFYSHTLGDTFRQCGRLFCILLRLKAWRLIVMAISIGPVMSTLYWMPQYFNRGNSAKNLDDSEGLKFYRRADFAAGKHEVYVDPAAKTLLSASENGKSSWMKDCSPERDCQEKLIHEEESKVIGQIRDRKSAGERAVLDCLYLKAPGVGFRCAYLYQIMAQSVAAKTSLDGAFKDVSFFILSTGGAPKVGKNKTNKDMKIPESTCATWVKKHIYLFGIRKSQPLVMGIAAIGVSVYILISTASCIRILKSEAFLQQLFRSGLSVLAYWVVIWIQTIAECLIFAGFFVLSHAVQCPGLHSSSSMVNLFYIFALFSLTLSGLILLLELLIPSMFVLVAMILVLSLSLIMGFIKNMNIQQSAFSFLLTIFPILNTNVYTTAQLNRSIALHRGLPTGNEAELSGILVANLKFFLVTFIVITYLDFLLKSGNGLCLPLYFPLSPKFWCPSCMVDKAQALQSDDQPTDPEPHIEPVAGLPPAVVVNGVSKTYTSCCFAGPTVLKSLSCKIYRGQITALIGHNGAGKSTLIKLLTGDELPDEGSGSINGCLATDALRRLALRGRVGICPQFDALCDSLTVIQCIWITLISKAANSDAELDRARQMLKKLGLGDKENVMSTDLSGGQKRKVSTILSLLGHPLVVFLDEPTSGLDPVSRRQLWQLLQEEKAGRAIILCTQFMDEADILADRKIFLCGGSIVCAGSSMFLKRAFGCSFLLDVSLKSKTDASTVMARLKGVRVRSQLETELQLEVPATEPAVLTKAVETLEASSEVAAFGLSQATLDDIFMRLSGVDADQVISALRAGDLSALAAKPDAVSDAAAAASADKLGAAGRSKATMKASMGRQFGTLFRTNLKRQWRIKSSAFSRIFLPLLLFCIIGLGGIIVNVAPEASEEDNSLYLQMDMHDSFDTIRKSDLGMPNEEVAIICISDEKMTEKDCDSLSLSYAKTSSYVILKPANQRLEDFIQLISAERSEECAKKYKECVVYYASWWRKKYRNNNRSVAIGYIGSRSENNVLHLYRRAFTKLLQRFVSANIEDTTALSFLMPISAISDSVFITVGQIFLFNLVLTLLPISYLSDPIEDMNSRVRCYLVSSGMTYLAYWTNTFILHWIQYAVCYVIAVGFSMIVEKLRYSYLLLVAFLPIFAFGIVSNQMTIYAIAVATKTRNTIVPLICYVFAIVISYLIMRLDMETSLAVSWLIPPVAPLVLLRFCSGYLNYKQEYYHEMDVSIDRNLFGCKQACRHLPSHDCHANSHLAVMLLYCSLRTLRYDQSQFGRMQTQKNWRVGESYGRPGFRGRGGAQGSRTAESIASIGSKCARSSPPAQTVRQRSPSCARRHLRREDWRDIRPAGRQRAGKTTTMAIIVGEEAATEGVSEVRVQEDGGPSRWLSGREAVCEGGIGYCAQHNPLFDCITVAEHIRFYADIRGVPKDIVDQQATTLMKELGLARHSEKQASQLSGGNKRRLCLAIAMLGNPALIIIDEASTGVDPENKRFIWASIRQMMRNWCSVMVTTHSMEEVEALCTRVGIMNRGQMISVGTVQQLRSFHGEAYTLEILLQPNGSATVEAKKQKQAAKKTLVARFRGAQVQEELGLGMQLTLPKASVPKLSEALRWLAGNQGSLGIAYWSLYQMSLDQVFVKIIKLYDEGGGNDNVPKTSTTRGDATAKP